MKHLYLMFWSLGIILLATPMLLATVYSRGTIPQSTDSSDPTSILIGETMLIGVTTFEHERSLVNSAVCEITCLQAEFATTMILSYSNREPLSFDVWQTEYYVPANFENCTISFTFKLFDASGDLVDSVTSYGVPQQTLPPSINYDFIFQVAGVASLTVGSVVFLKERKKK